MEKIPINEVNARQGQVLDSSSRESMEYDVLIVGAGPAGLSAAIQLKQISQKNNLDLSVCVLEKASEVGAHILSGAVIETVALDRLLPNWKEMDSPIKTKVKKDKLSYFGKDWSFSIPQIILPPMMKNHGNYIVSLSNVCKWLGEVAEGLGVEIYPGFSAAEVLFDDNKKVKIKIDSNKMKPIIIIDGEEMGLDFDMSSIDPDSIESINVLKGQKALQKVGEKGSNGVILIQMKKQ